MRPTLIGLTALLATPAVAQMRQDPKPTPSPSPTKVVARSGRLVTARTKGGGTQSYNCKRPENAGRAICKGATETLRVTPK